MSPTLFLDDGLNVAYEEHFYELSEADDIFNELKRAPFYTPVLRIYGRECRPKRKVCAYGDEGVNYSFSGTSVVSIPWSPLMTQIKTDVERSVGCSFNYALLNLYEDGNSTIDEHKDDESSLNLSVPIVGLSFGSSRTIEFKRRNCRGTNVRLHHGSMYVMHYPTNELFTHSIPAEPECTLPRISITFRRIDRTEQPPAKKPKIDYFPSEYQDEDGCLRATHGDWLDKMVWQLNVMEPTHFELSYETLVSVKEFRNKFFIDVRKCVSTKNGNKLPTKCGITMSAKTWYFFTKHLSSFNFLYPTASFVANNAVIAMNHDNQMQLIQLDTLPSGDLFQKKLYSLSKWEVQRLCEQENEITNCVIECLWHEQLIRKFIMLESRDLFTSESSNLMTSFVKIAEKHLSECIKTVFECQGCVRESASQLDHECIHVTEKEKFQHLGERILLLMDPVSFARELYEYQFFDKDFFNSVDMCELKNKLFTNIEVKF